MSAAVRYNSVSARMLVRVGGTDYTRGFREKQLCQEVCWRLPTLHSGRGPVYSPRPSKLSLEDMAELSGGGELQGTETLAVALARVTMRTESKAAKQKD